MTIYHAVQYNLNTDKRDKEDFANLSSMELELFTMKLQYFVDKYDRKFYMSV